MGRRKKMADDDIDQVIIATILSSMPTASHDDKARVIVSYWRDTQGSRLAHPWRTYTRAPLRLQIGVALVALGWLLQVTCAVVLVTQL
jgi:hypothetical protein